MAYVLLKRSRGTANYYLLESRRDPDTGKVKKTVLAYLGTEESGLDSPESALMYWMAELEEIKAQLAAVPNKQRPLLRRKRDRIKERIRRIKPYSTHKRVPPAKDSEKKARARRTSPGRGREKQTLGRPITAKKLREELKVAQTLFARKWRKALLVQIGSETPRVRILTVKLGGGTRKYAVYSLGNRDVFCRSIGPSPDCWVLDEPFEKWFHRYGGKIA